MTEIEELELLLKHEETLYKKYRKAWINSPKGTFREERSYMIYLYQNNKLNELKRKIKEKN